MVGWELLIRFWRTLPLLHLTPGNCIASGVSGYIPDVYPVKCGCKRGV